MAGRMTPRGYAPRLQDGALERALETFGAVEVAGTMWCGKTWTSLAHGASVTRVGRPGVARVAEADPSAALVGEAPHVIDEWQDVPAIWDAVRDAVDAAGPGAAGMFVLTGSSEPRKDLVSHSGAGRIGRIRMRPMSLQETGESSGAVSLAGLFEGRFEPVLVQQGLAPLADAVCRGGWPALMGSDPSRAAAYLDAYFDALFDVNMPRRGVDGGDARAVAASIARNMGSAAKVATVAADAFGGSGLASATAARKASEAISALEALYVVEAVPGWDAPVRARSRLRTKPKLYFADPSLAASLLRVGAARLMEDGQLFGVLFEALAMRDLQVYASLLPGAPRDPLRHYRDSDGLEVDAVIELRDGRWAAIEVKLGEAKAEDGFAALDRLRRKVASNPAARNPAPEFCAVIVGAGELARRDADADAYVIPLTALGA